MFGKVLVANRGAIANRIFRTLRKMGIASVSVYSEADRDARPVLDADEAVLLGPSPANQSYLSIDRVLAAAEQSGPEQVLTEDLNAGEKIAGIEIVNPFSGA